MVEVPLTKQETDVTPVALERSSAQSHIRGLGLDDRSNPRQKSKGLVGQINARKGLGVIKKMIESGKIAGRAILLAGQPGTGKTALAHALSLELGPGTPFTSITGSEVFSLEMNKTEALTQALRRSIGVKIHEVTEVCEGEVVSIEINAPSGEQAQRTGSITLKTTDMESVFDLGPRMIDQITRLKIEMGDVISIDTATGNMTKLGRSFAHSKDFDSYGPQMKFVHTPDGELKSKKETVHTLTLHEIDVVNSRNQGFLALFSGETGEIKQEIREHVDKQVVQWQDEKRAELIPGVLFIDEVHMLDLECFSFLNRAMENPTAPIIIMASNRGETKVRGTNYQGPHGIPFDMVQRLLIIPTIPYNENDLREILQLRCEDEDVQMSEEALTALTEQAATRSLRYAMQLITTSSLIAARREDYEDEVNEEDILKAQELFIDKERSEQYLEQLSSFANDDYQARFSIENQGADQDDE
ncbi:RuvB-like 2 [Tritrichomonas foetus]|uniref:RuvB-like helicase n=1 Tax=Tritrichomonas foetus TaxID=1144522 RepID=A0A1J4KIM2_9EUKA|nr:RuvB-like 2 [Tritrichomonas foetus]|eukprot:OHT09157.1 RuvB-like 2 [Tritrichomonas foetus]